LIHKWYEEYFHDSVQFTSLMEGLAYAFKNLLSMQDLLNTFFTKKTLRKICKQTNNYAASIDPKTKSIREPHDWYRLRKCEHRSMVRHMYADGGKVLPIHKAY
jgi:hypothetical protein